MISKIRRNLRKERRIKNVKIWVSFNMILCFIILFCGLDITIISYLEYSNTDRLQKEKAFISRIFIIFLFFS